MDSPNSERFGCWNETKLNSEFWLTQNLHCLGTPRYQFRIRLHLLARVGKQDKSETLRSRQPPPNTSNTTLNTSVGVGSADLGSGPTRVAAQPNTCEPPVRAVVVVVVVG